MNREWETVCVGISRCLFRRELPLPEGIDWQEVFSESKKQCIGAIVFYGLASCVPEEVKRQWALYNTTNLAHGVCLLHETQTLTDLFRENGIPFTVLKGSAAAVYYPEPLYRTMGDIDLFVLPEDFDRARDCMLARDYAPDKREEDNPRHMIFFRNGIRFELHHYFGGPGSEMDRYIVRAFPRVESASVGGKEFRMLPTLENGLVILDHIRQELQTGLGIRQILDWAMYVNAALDDDFWDRAFRAAAAELGLEKLARTMTLMAQRHLGLNPGLRWCADADSAVADRLMDNLIVSGNFGQNNGSGAAIERTAAAFRRVGFFRHLQHAGEYNWRAYREHRWLKPFAWLYQIGRYIIQGLRTRRSGSQIREDAARGADRHRLLKDLGL